MDAFGDVLVLGLGTTGRDVAHYLAGRARTVCVYGGPSSVEGSAAASLRAAGVRVVLGTDAIDGRYDLAIASPGISEHTPFFTNACSHATEIIGEPELAWRESPERWVAITGTNGKTTTTTLTRDLLRSGGLVAEAVGNIGTSAISMVDGRAVDGWFVAELSSYQLATTVRFHPRVAVLLNVSPDHLSWHKTMERYAAAKARVFTNVDESDLAVVSVDDPWCQRVVEELDGRGLRVCRLSLDGDTKTPCAAFVAGGRLMVRANGAEHGLLPVAEMGVRGRHNVQNALAAAAAAVECGVDDGAINDTLASFATLEHRIEPCGTVAGISFVNDSKATNVDATLAALSAFAPKTVVLLLGGSDKGTELGGLARAAVRDCRAIVCFGDAGPRMAEAVRDAARMATVQVIDANHLADAVHAAYGVARVGDTVLLSPACASFDEFGSFEERGHAFKDIVASIIREGKVV